MKCYYHPENDAVGQCQDCGKFVCKECARTNRPILCEECFSDRVKAKGKEINEYYSEMNMFYISRFIIASVIGAIFVAISNVNTGMDLNIGYLFVFAFPFGYLLCYRIGDLIFGKGHQGSQFIIFNILKAVFSAPFGIIGLFLEVFLITKSLIEAKNNKY